MFVDDGLTPQFLSSKDLKRRAIIKRYANVAKDLPEWAQDALCVQMGTVKVAARDSFELFLIKSGGFLPKYDYVNFQKRFAEIWRDRGVRALKKVMDSRAKNRDFYISNDYFWQEFCELFAFKPLKESQVEILWDKFLKGFWATWNKFLSKFLRALCESLKVGLSGRSRWWRWLLKFKTEGTQREAVKWQ